MTFLLTNLRLKLLAIALATSFWGVVAYTANPTQSKPYHLSIAPTNLPQTLIIVGDIPQVSVTVVGTAENLRIFDSHALHVSANFAGVRIGTNRVSVHVDSSDPTVSVNQPDPVTVSVDEIASAVETVTIERVHNLPSGYHEVTASTTVTPQTVRVQGPKSLLTGSQAVVLVDLDSQAAPLNQAYNVLIRDANRAPLDKMTISPAQVTVKMTIQQDAVTETKLVGWTTTGQAAACNRMTNVQLAPQQVNATGLAATLAGLQQVTSDPVDISNASADVIKTVRLHPPAGVDVSPVTVQVHVFISKIPGCVTP